jgi:hypothetical protein
MAAPRAPALSCDDILERFGLCVRALGRRPRQSEFVAMSGVSRHFIALYFEGWRAVEPVFSSWAQQRAEFATEATLLAAPARVRHGHAEPPDPPLPSTAMAALPPLGPAGERGCLTHCPINEQGVVLLFGGLARELGFRVLSIQGAFPDCLAVREQRPGRWTPVRIEFEYESRNFAAHGHNPAGCDLIVCWRHNWPDCPLAERGLQSASTPRRGEACFARLDPVPPPSVAA